MISNDILLYESTPSLGATLQEKEIVKCNRPEHKLPKAMQEIG